MTNLLDISCVETWGFLNVETQYATLGNEYLELLLTAKNMGQLMKSKTFRSLFENASIIEMPKDLSISQYSKLWMIYAMLSSGYLFSTHEEVLNVLPKSLAVPLYKLSQMLGVPPILNYYGHGLSNFRVLPGGGNYNDPTSYEPLYTFSSQADDEYEAEKWFLTIHIAIERSLGPVVAQLGSSQRDLINDGQSTELANFLKELSRSIVEVTAIISRMPEKLSPNTFTSTIRKYLSSFNGVVFEGVSEFKGEPQYFGGVSAGQSPSFQAIDAFLGINNESSYRGDLEKHMPAGHRKYIDQLKRGKNLKIFSEQNNNLKNIYNGVVKHLINFRNQHRHMAGLYLSRNSLEIGTGNTSFQIFLRSCIANSKSAMIQPDEIDKETGLKNDNNN